MTESKGATGWDRTALIVAVVSATVAIGGVAVGYLIAREDRSGAEQLAARQRAIEITKIRLQIIDAVNRYDQPTAELLMDHVLRPNDESADFAEFSRRYRGLVAERAPAATVADSKQYQKTAADEASVPREDLVALVRLFTGDDRLTASNRLVALYPTRSSEVVRALIEGLVDENERRVDAYRINLYVAFTLARIAPYWVGSPDQIARIQQLTGTRSYRDATFKRRVDEALQAAHRVE